MNKTNQIIFISLILTAGFFFLAPAAHAMTPTITSITSTGSGDYVQINVTGDPSASVNLFINSYSILLGNLNSNGTNSFTIGSAQSENGVVAIAANTTVYVKTGGINGTPSSNVTWPYIQNSTTTSSLTLSQSAILLNAGQTSTITASASYLYLLSNSNPSVSNVNFNGSQITVQALTYGSTTANICIVGSTTNCATLSIVVQNSSSQQLSFSQNNFSIVSGQSAYVTVSGGSGTYTISNNSNSNSIQASLSGSTVTLTATGTVGAASVTVCTSDVSSCGIINVSSTALNSTSISFSQTNPVVAIGQSATVTIYGGTSGGNFYVSSNSNPSLVQANINSNILTLIANATTGTSTITICAYQGSCGSLTANVSSASNGGAIALSQSAISLLAGQSSNITISGGSTPYSVSSPVPANIFNGIVNGNILTVYGVNAGTATANVCSSSGCTILTVTISSLASSTTNPPTFSQNNILLNVGQQSTVYVSGSGNFYIGNNASPDIASFAINGSSIVVTAVASGNSSASICQSGGQCSTLYVTVNSLAQPVAPQTTSTPYVFTRLLKYNDKGSDVLELQKILVQLGFLTVTPTGHFGAATVNAVKKLQAAHGIRQLGNVGPATEAFLNQLQVPVTNATTATTQGSSLSQQQIQQIQQEIQQLETQISSSH